MESVECATFHLNTADIDFQATGNISNRYGATDQYKTNIIWYNVSLKTIMGSMYDEYDTFNIKLSSIMYGTIAAPSTNPSQLSLKINVVGLPFKNCTYNTYTNSNTNTCTMGSFTIGTTGTQMYYNDDNVFSIEKPPESCNIGIILLTIAGNVPAWTTLGPQMDFYFRIYGIKKHLC